MSLHYLVMYDEGEEELSWWHGTIPLPPCPYYLIPIRGRRGKLYIDWTSRERQD